MKAAKEGVIWYRTGEVRTWSRKPANVVWKLYMLEKSNKLEKGVKNIDIVRTFIRIQKNFSF